MLAIAGFATGLLLGLYGLGLIAPKNVRAGRAGGVCRRNGGDLLGGVRTPLNGYWYTLVGSGTIVIVGSRCLSAVLIDAAQR